ILLLIAANMVEPPEGAPPLRQAFSLTRYSSVSLMSPCLRALKTTSAVISFIMLDGARNSSAFFSNSTLPLDASIRIAVGASPSKPPSSFLAPCTLLLAACTVPARLTASKTTAAIIRRHEIVAEDFGLPKRPDAIGSSFAHALCVLTVEISPNNMGLRADHSGALAGVRLGFNRLGTAQRKPLQ